MTWAVRDQYALMGLIRPDVPSVQYGVALQAAIKDVCRETLAARATYDFSILALNNAVTLAVTNGLPLMVHEVLWKATTDLDWTPLFPIAYPTAFAGELWEQSGTTPESYSQQGENLLIYGTPTVDGTLRVNLSYVPTVDVDSAPLAAWALPAVLLKAESILLGVPGPYANLQASIQKGRAYAAMLSDLKAKSLYGESGEVQMFIPLNPYRC